jgi:hypothetical protein
MQQLRPQDLNRDRKGKGKEKGSGKRSAMNPGPKKKTKPKRRTAEEVKEKREKGDPGPREGCLKGKDGVDLVSDRRRNPKLRSGYDNVREESVESMERMKEKEDLEGMFDLAFFLFLSLLYSILFRSWYFY